MGVDNITGEYYIVFAREPEELCDLVRWLKSHPVTIYRCPLSECADQNCRFLHSVVRSEYIFDKAKNSFKVADYSAALEFVRRQLVSTFWTTRDQDVRALVDNISYQGFDALVTLQTFFAKSGAPGRNRKGLGFLASSFL